MKSLHAKALLIAGILAIAFFSHCGKKYGNQDGSLAITLSDSIHYIKIPDAATFLPSWSKENILIYHTLAEPDILHPTNGTSSMRTEIFQYTQMSLFRFDFRSLSLEPALLKTMPEVNGDGTVYTCELREELKWDDGSPVTAADVVFTAKASKCPLTDNPHAKPYWDNLSEISIHEANPLKFTVRMKTPYIHNLVFWADWPIMQRAFFDPSNELGNYAFAQLDDSAFSAAGTPSLVAWANNFNDAKYSREPEFLNGLGMYRVSAWDPGQSVTLQKKENHWTAGSTSIYETAYPEKIIYKVNKDPNSTLLDFKGQVLDGSNLLPTETLLTLQSDSTFNRNYHSRFTDSFNYTYVGMNTKPDGLVHKKLFDDKKTRKAMALLTPVDNLNKIINKGMNKRMVGPVSILKKDFDPSLQPIPFDPKEAQRLLSEAGWSDTDGDHLLDKMVDGEKIKFEFFINYMTNTPNWKDYAALLSEAFSKAGINAILNPLDYSVFVANAKKHDFDMMVGAWGQTALPEDFTQLWHTGSWLNEGSNYTGFGNDESDVLIDSIKVTVDDVKRSALVKRFQNIVHDEQPVIFLFASLRRNVIHKRFGNVEMYFEMPGILLNNLRLLSTTNSPNP